MTAPLTPAEYALTRLVAVRLTDEVLAALLRLGKGGPSYSGGNSDAHDGTWYEASRKEFSSYTLVRYGDDIEHVPGVRVTWARLEALADALPADVTEHLAELRDRQLVLNRAHWAASQEAQDRVWRRHVSVDGHGPLLRAVVARERAVGDASWHWDVEVVRPAVLAALEHLDPDRVTVQLGLFGEA